MIADLLDRRSEAARIEVERTACLLCRAEEQEAIFRTDFPIVRCQRCGLHFTNPRPTVDSMAAFYPQDYRPHLGKANHHRPLRSWYPLDWLKPSRSHSRLLDFGCGAGHFLAAMDRNGWEVAGLDVSQATVDSIRSGLGLTAFAGTLPHDELEAGSFDCVTLWHSLEHVHDPVTTLREARRLLTRDGRLIIAVPNFAGWSRRRFGEHWFGLDLPRHLTHFEPTTLTAMLQKAGFRVHEMRFARHADWIRSSAQRAGMRWPNRLMSKRWAAEMIARYWVGGGDGDAILACASPA